MDKNSIIIPEHVAIIMDGNGRWAEMRGKNRTFGHLEGVKTADKIISYAEKIGIRFLTLYAFSTENWNRSKIEVEFLMKIFKKKLEEAISNQKRNIKFQVIGEKEKISNNIINLINILEEKTRLNNSMTLNIAFNYGSKSEIVNSVKLIINNIQNQKINLENITKEKLWQIAYAELFFTKTLWPNFSEKDFENAILEFNKRERRYGRIN